MVGVRVSCSEGVASRTGPRVMAVLPGEIVASVDRGGHGLGIEPRTLYRPERRRYSPRRRDWRMNHSCFMPFMSFMVMEKQKEM